MIPDDFHFGRGVILSYLNIRSSNLDLVSISVGLSRKLIQTHIHVMASSPQKGLQLSSAPCLRVTIGVKNLNKIGFGTRQNHVMGTIC